MRIGIVINRYPVQSEPFIRVFFEHLSQHHLVVFTHPEPGSTLPPNVKIVPFINYLSPFSDILNFIRIFGLIPFFIHRFFFLYRNGIPAKQLLMDAGIITTLKLDVLHFPFGNLAFGREHYASLVGAKMTLSFRGSDLNVFPVFHSKSYETLWPFVFKVHCNSIELAEGLKTHRIPSFIPIVIIPPALRRELESVSHSLPKHGLALGTVEHPLRMVSLGRLHWVKDYPLALRILSGLKQNGLFVHFTILGEGKDREQLMFLTKELGLSDCVILKGAASESIIRASFSKAHLYLQTSYAEGFSNACLEAQAFGLPCIVPAISGMEACVEDGKTGIIVRQRSEIAFVDAILEFVANPDVFNPKAISERVKQLFSLEIQATHWQKFFEEGFSNHQKN